MFQSVLCCFILYIENIKEIGCNRLQENYLLDRQQFKKRLQKQKQVWAELSQFQTNLKLG